MGKPKPEQSSRGSREEKLPKSAMITRLAKRSIINGESSFYLTLINHLKQKNDFSRKMLESENQKLKSLIGGLTLELKKPKKSCYEKKNLKCCNQEKQAYFEANRRT